MDDPVLVVGAGPIGSEYVKVLRHLGCSQIDVLTRGDESAARAGATLQLRRAFAGGNAALASAAADYRFILIAVPVDELLPALRIVTVRAAKVEVLIEKPVALFSGDLGRFLDDHPDCRAMAALNRLFFPSVQALRRKLINETPLSGRFCFTEWLLKLPTERFSGRVLAHWGVANSIHPIAAFFDLLGLPRDITPIIAGAGAIPWHPAGARFYGAGRTVGGLPFAYDADWQSGGRHAMEIFTAAGVYSLKPLQQLSFTPREAVAEQVIEPIYNGELKCGFEGLVTAFLTGAPETRTRLGLPRLLQHIRTVETIFGYPPDQPG